MATLTVTIKEEIELYGEPRGGITTKTISNVTKTYKSVIDVPVHGTETIIYKVLSGRTGAGLEDVGKTEYIRVTNVDTTEVVELKIKTSGGDYHLVELAADESFVMFNDKDFVEESSFTNSSWAYENIETIEAYGKTAASRVEVFTASIN